MIMTGGEPEEEAGEYGEAEQDFERGASDTLGEMQGSGTLNLCLYLCMNLQLYLCLYLQLFFCLH